MTAKIVSHKGNKLTLQLEVDVSSAESILQACREVGNLALKESLKISESKANHTLMMNDISHPVNQPDSLSIYRNRQDDTHICPGPVVVS